MARQRPKRLPLPDPIARFVEAINRGDSKSFLSFFPEDGVWTNVTIDWVSKSFTGPSCFVFVLERRQVQEMRINSA